jgi:hypothetical protein
MGTWKWIITFAPINVLTLSLYNEVCFIVRITSFPTSLLNYCWGETHKIWYVVSFLFVFINIIFNIQNIITFQSNTNYILNHIHLIWNVIRLEKLNYSLSEYPDVYCKVFRPKSCYQLIQNRGGSSQYAKFTNRTV